MGEVALRLKKRKKKKMGQKRKREEQKKRSIQWHKYYKEDE